MNSTQNGLVAPADAAALIDEGRVLAIAADESVLTALPRGNWIGGTTPYFMTAEQGQCRRDQVFIQELVGMQASFENYSAESLHGFLEDAPEHGYSIIILPAGSEVHRRYAEESPRYPDMYLKPVAGWVSGVHLDNLATATPAVFDGRTGERFADRAVVIHQALPEGRSALVHAINLYEPGQGADISFPATGFEMSDCEVDGQPANLARYLDEIGADTRLPLVADYCGAAVNVSIQSIDLPNGQVHFYAPVFPGLNYRLARPVSNYPERFTASMPSGTGQILFGCNCILNYLHCGLEGRATPGLTGPITFGEVAYQLLNQTAVFLTLEED